MSQFDLPLVFCAPALSRIRFTHPAYLTDPERTWSEPRRERQLCWLASRRLARLLFPSRTTVRFVEIHSATISMH